MKIKTGFVIVVFLSLISFTGCTNPQNDSENESEALVLKSYEVPERMAEQVRGIIGNLLASRPGTGRANIAPNGQLLVAAPKSFHDGVKDFISRLQNANPEPSPTVEVNYWIVAGRKSNKPATLEEFKMIKPALESIQNTQGNMEFKLLDHAILTSLDKEEAWLNGALFNIQQTLYSYGDDSLLFSSKIENHPAANPRKGCIGTEIEIQSGKLVVLGKVSQEFNIPIFSHAEEGKPHFETVSVFYIISAAVKK